MIHFGPIFKMGDQIFKIMQFRLNVSKSNTFRGSSLQASLSSLLRNEQFATARGKCKADLGTLQGVRRGENRKYFLSPAVLSFVMVS